MSTTDLSEYELEMGIKRMLIREALIKDLKKEKVYFFVI